MHKTSVVEEIPYGVYIAKTSEGAYIANKDGDMLNIVSKKGDQRRISQLKAAARHFGFEDIKYEFRAGARQISEDEFQTQLERQDQGLIADPYDLGVLIDEYKKGKSA